MATLKCPLENLKGAETVTLAHLHKIEEHISSNSSCSHPDPPLLKDLVILKGSFKGSTPLLLACHHGEIDCVKHIVENWGVDLRQAQSVYPIADIKATPLFVASLQGHLEIVRYLVAKGADVSAKTSSMKYQYHKGLTPLHGAVYELSRSSTRQLRELPLSQMRKERSAIVRFLLESGADPSALSSDRIPIWKRPLCGFDSTIALINHGMNLHQRDPSDDEHRDKTILHHWCFFRRPIDNPITAEEDTLTVVKLLLDKGADPMARDYEGFTPILLSALNISDCEITNAVLNFLLERGEIGRLQKIDAMEFAGAVIIHHCPFNDDYLFKAFEYWHGALYLRLVETDGTDGQIYKTPMKSGRIVEWVSSTELEHIIKDSSDCLIQSFLVRLRILSKLPGENWDAIDLWLFRAFFLRDDCSRLEDEQRFVDILHILWAMLESISLFNSGEDGLGSLTIMAIEQLVMTLAKLEKDDLNVEAMKTSLKLTLATDNCHLDSSGILKRNQHVETLFKLFTMLTDLPELLDEEIMGYLSKLVHRDRHDGRGRNLVLMARGIAGKNLPTVRLLLQAGADDPNADN